MREVDVGVVLTSHRLRCCEVAMGLAAGMEGIGDRVKKDEGMSEKENQRRYESWKSIFFFFLHLH